MIFSLKWFTYIHIQLSKWIFSPPDCVCTRNSIAQSPERVVECRQREEGICFVFLLCSSSLFSSHSIGPHSRIYNPFAKAWRITSRNRHASPRWNWTFPGRGDSFSLSHIQQLSSFGSTAWPQFWRHTTLREPVGRAKKKGKRAENPMTRSSRDSGRPYLHKF